MKLFRLPHMRADTDAKEKIRLSGDDFAAQNPYYASIARGYHLAQMILFGILAGFVILSMLIRSDDITYENFFYLFKDIHAAVDSTDVSFTSLVYDADETQNFAAYRGGLAVAGESGLTVFTATGRRTLKQDLSMNSPQLLASSRYLLVYAQGGHDFAVYNSFARIHSGQTKGEISCAAISDSGWVVLASTNGSSSSVISVYDKHMNKKTEYFRNAYVTALALNDSGSLLAVVTTDAVAGSYQTKLELYRPGTDDKVFEQSFEAFFPLACSFAEDNIMYLTGTDRMLVLRGDGEILTDLSFDIGIYRAYHSAEGYALLLADETLVVYRKDGTLIGQRTDAGDIRSVLVGKNVVYMMTDDTLMTYRLSTGESSSVTYDFTLQELLWYAEDELLLCSRSTARYLNTSH